jgi:hypothetical protein
MITLRRPLALPHALLVARMDFVPLVLHWMLIELVVLAVALPSCDQFQPFGDGVHPFALAEYEYDVPVTPLLGPEIWMVVGGGVDPQSCGQLELVSPLSQVPLGHTGSGGPPWTTIGAWVKMCSSPVPRRTRSFGV